MPWPCSELTSIRVAPPRSRLQAAARRQVDRVGEAVALGVRLGLVGAVVAAARDLVEVLVQRAAEGDVQLLDAAADGEQRHAARHGAADQRQGGGVARRVGEVVLARGRAAVVRGVDVGRAAGDHDAVQSVEQRVRVEPIGQGRDQDRQRPGADHHRVDILGADRVEVELVARLQAGGDTDEREHGFAGHGSFPQGRSTHRRKGGLLPEAPLPMSTLKIGPAPLPGPDPRELAQAACASGLLPSITRGRLAAAPISIFRGFIASGTSRSRSTSSSPLFRRAPLTLTWSASWKRCSKARCAMPRCRYSTSFSGS